MPGRPKDQCYSLPFPVSPLNKLPQSLPLKATFQGRLLKLSIPVPGTVTDASHLLVEFNRHNPEAAVYPLSSVQLGQIKKIFKCGSSVLLIICM